MKLRHIVSHFLRSNSTERTEVLAWCGESEEASGSGEHTLDKGDELCKVCERLAKANEDTEEDNNG